MSRRELREQIFKLLFRIEFNKAEEMEEQKDLFFEDVSFQMGVYLCNSFDCLFVNKQYFSVFMFYFLMKEYEI